MEDMKLNCPNCGAPITGDICPYCNTHIEINGGNDSFESYETIECKEANISLWTVAFPMIFGVSFGTMGPMFAIITLTEGEFVIWVFMMGLLFGLIGLGAWVVALTPIVRYIQVKSHGRDVEGTVMGYSNDNVYLNGSPAKIIKIKIDSDEGPKIINYQSGATDKPYDIQSKIMVRVYKDMFYIKKKNKYYFDK